MKKPNEKLEEIKTKLIANIKEHNGHMVLITLGTDEDTIAATTEDKGVFYDAVRVLQRHIFAEKNK